MVVMTTDHLQYELIPWKLDGQKDVYKTEGSHSQVAWSGNETKEQCPQLQQKQ